MDHPGQMRQVSVPESTGRGISELALKLALRAAVFPFPISLWACWRRVRGDSLHPFQKADHSGSWDVCSVPEHWVGTQATAAVLWRHWVHRPTDRTEALTLYSSHVRAGPLLHPASTFSASRTRSLISAVSAGLDSGFPLPAAHLSSQR